ncbi:MAG TPA: hypothetical protein VGR47_03225 [Terracidiphilus sp.]|nr:hypothetical protein [Terracidiphilus sp.]
MNLKPLAINLTCSVVALAMPFAACAQSRPAAQAHMPPSSVAPGVHGLRCLAADEKTPCSAAQIDQLNQMVVTGRRSYPVLAAVHSLSLSSSDGTLRCTQDNGAACSVAQIEALQQYAAAKKKKGGGGCICVMKEIDAASP